MCLWQCFNIFEKSTYCALLSQFLLQINTIGRRTGFSAVLHRVCIWGEYLLNLPHNVNISYFSHCNFDPIDILITIKLSSFSNNWRWCLKFINLFNISFLIIFSLFFYLYLTIFSNRNVFWQNNLLSLVSLYRPDNVNKIIL